VVRSAEADPRRARDPPPRGRTTSSLRRLPATASRAMEPNRCRRSKCSCSKPAPSPTTTTSITNCLRKCLSDNLKLVSHATTSHFFFCTGDICPALRRCRSILQVTVVPVLCCRHFCVKAIVLGFYVEVTDATHCSIYLGDSII
jgi:hypothetical protein